MRLAIVIVAMAAIGLTLVQLRREEVAVCHEIRTIESQETALRREIWDRQAEMGRWVTPEAIDQQTREMELTARPKRPEAPPDHSEWPR